VLEIDQLVFNEEFLVSAKALWARFWKGRFPIELWNINSVPQRDLVGRTNNAIECYNRRMSEQVPNAYPNLLAFVATIQKEVEQSSLFAKNIRVGVIAMPQLDRDFVKPKISHEYFLFIKAQQ
jgi:hypothetical protein